MANSAEFPSLVDDWMFLGVGDLAPVDHVDEINHDPLGTHLNRTQGSIGENFVDDLFQEISQSSTDPAVGLDHELLTFSNSDQETCESTSCLSVFEASQPSASIGDVSTATSEDEGYVSLDQCSASLGDLLGPEDFNALLDTLTQALPPDVLTSPVVLDDACTNLSQYTTVDNSPSIEPDEIKAKTAITGSTSSSIETTKPDISYIELVAKAIMASPDNSVLLGDIYRWIEDTYPHYKHTKNSWRNSIRHNLSVNECFVKGKRVRNGRGFYWSIHPSCIDAFKNDDFDRRKARRQVQQCNRAFSSALEELNQLKRNTVTSGRHANYPIASNTQNSCNSSQLHLPSTSTPVRTQAADPGHRYQYTNAYHNYTPVYPGWY